MLERLLTATILMLGALVLGSGCEKPEADVTVKITREGEGEKVKAPMTPSEVSASQKARKINQGEPVVDPESQREKFLLVWGVKGKKKLDRVYQEREELIMLLNTAKGLSKDQRAVVDLVIPVLRDFGIGRKPAELEQAPAALCAMVDFIRPKASQLIDIGYPRIDEINAEEKALVVKRDAGEEVLQKTFDKLDEERKKLSAPVLAGKKLLLVLRSVFDEAYVLADRGPRRTQKALTACLTPHAAKEFRLQDAQKALAKALERASYYE